MPFDYVDVDRPTTRQRAKSALHRYYAKPLTRTQHQQIANRLEAEELADAVHVLRSDFEEVSAAHSKQIIDAGGSRGNVDVRVRAVDGPPPPTGFRELSPEERAYRKRVAKGAEERAASERQQEHERIQRAWDKQRVVIEQTRADARSAEALSGRPGLHALLPEPTLKPPAGFGIQDGTIRYTTVPRVDDGRNADGTHTVRTAVDPITGKLPGQHQEPALTPEQKFAAEAER